MTKQLTALILAVFIAAGPLSGIGIAGADCSSHPCCCHGPSMGDSEAGAGMIRSVHECCCNPAGGPPCTLIPYQLPENLGWAVSTISIEAPYPNVSGTIRSSAISVSLQMHPYRETESNVLQIASTQIYLSVMSFLC